MDALSGNLGISDTEQSSTVHKTFGVFVVMASLCFILWSVFAGMTFLNIGAYSVLFFL